MSHSSLLRHRSVHMIGIKGAGMTALAELLVLQGVTVTGSDTEEVFFTDAILKRLKIPVVEHFAPENIPVAATLIIYSTVYAAESNSELRAAQEKNIPVLSYPEALGLLTREKMTLAVCGTHGKTTTSALLADTLRALGADPSAIVGSHIMNWQGNALAGRGNFLVLEADEYQNKLKEYTPFAVILTSVDWDHPDFFPDRESYEQVFADFVARIPAQGFLVYCADSASVVRVARTAKCRTVSYGTLPGADFRVTDYTPEKPGFVLEKRMIRQTFSIQQDDKTLGAFRLQLAGIHNALNATAVVALLVALGKMSEGVGSAFSSFSGTERRFELIGERYGASIYDDYAHHPEEIRATLRAFRDLYPDRVLTVIFHPHTFTRTKALFTDFAQSFDVADRVILLDIYGSAREKQGEVSSQELSDAINRFFPGKAEYAPDTKQLILDIEKKIGRQDVIITLGAGDVWKISHQLAKVQE